MPRFQFLNGCFLAAAMGLLTSQASAVEDLNDVLKETKWSGLIGTWVDEATQGRGLTIRAAWKIKNHVIEFTQKEPQKETVSLICLQAKTGKIVQMGAASDGSSFLAEWTTKSTGEAVVGIGFMAPDGSEGVLNIRQKIDGNDKMVITIELPQPITINMVRAANKK